MESSRVLLSGTPPGNSDEFGGTFKPVLVAIRAMDRRTVLGRIAGVAIVVTAGCAGDDGDTVSPTPTDPSDGGELTDTPTSTPTRTPTATRSQSPAESPTSTPTGTDESTSPVTTTPTRTATPTETPSPTATPQPDADQIVTVAPGGSFRFDPSSFTISVGSTVLWEWEGGGHNVIPDSTPSGTSWEGTPGGSGTTYGSGYTHTHEFTTAGEYGYYCAPHRNLGMTGSFTVE